MTSVTDPVQIEGKLRTLIEKRFPETGVFQIACAVEWGKAAHEGQVRKGGTQYIVHPLRVATFLLEVCADSDADEVVAALLHDVLEDSQLKTATDIEAKFGGRVRRLVTALTSPTEDEIPDKAERNRAKAAKAAAASPSARRIKLVDRIDNMRDACSIDGPAGAAFRARYQDESMRYYLPVAEQLGNAALLAAFLGGLAELREHVLRDGLGVPTTDAAAIEVNVRRMFLPADPSKLYAQQQAAGLDEMRRLEAGEIVNTAEGWQTGHYWLRQSPNTPAEHCPVITTALKAIDQFYANTFKDRFSCILWIGIGGSALGPQMLYDALREPGKTPAMFFLDNTDPDGFDRTFCDIRTAAGFDKTLVVVVSKSGRTKETRNGMLSAKRAFEHENLVFEEHAVAITKEGSNLDEVAEGKAPCEPASTAIKWLGRFPIWDWVGGRTSLFSPVGILPARLLGFDVKEFIDGAHDMDVITASPEMTRNPALLLATTWYHAVEHLGLRNMVVLPYCDRLILMSRYLQQLVMESLGKDGKGITVYGNKGSTDQHSFVQQLRDGYRDFFVAFLRVHGTTHADDSPFTWEIEPGLTAGDYLAAFQTGTEQALCDAGRLSLNLTLRDGLDERSLGALIALFERTVGYFAPMINVNAYHQPGVEAGKAAADEAIAAQLRITRFLTSTASVATIDEISRENSVSPVIAEAILLRLARESDSAIVAHFDANSAVTGFSCQNDSEK